MDAEQVFYLFDHDENEELCIVGLEEFIQWLNDNDDHFSFSLNKFDFEPRKA